MEELREILRSNSGRIAFAKRLAILLAVVAAAIWLSTLDFGDDPQSESFEGGFFTQVIPWAIAFFAGGMVVRWVQRESLRIATARAEDRGSAVASAEGPPPRELPGPRFDDFLQEHRFVASAIAGVAVLLIVLLPLGWWSSASSTLRTFLEGLPLGSAVATTPAEHGSPAVVCVIFGVLVGAAIVATSMWRIHSVRGYLYAGNTFVQVFIVGMIRTVVIFGGLTLVPILGVVAAGTDLRDEPSHTFTGPVWPLLVIVCWVGFTYVGLRTVHDREAQRPARAGSL